MGNLGGGGQNCEKNGYVVCVWPLWNKKLDQISFVFHHGMFDTQTQAQTQTHLCMKSSEHDWALFRPTWKFFDLVVGLELSRKSIKPFNLLSIDDNPFDFDADWIVQSGSRWSGSLFNLSQIPPGGVI